jgi:hypothetical protein
MATDSPAIGDAQYSSLPDSQILRSRYRTGVLSSAVQCIAHSRVRNAKTEGNSSVRKSRLPHVFGTEQLLVAELSPRMVFPSMDGSSLVLGDVQMLRVEATLITASMMKTFVAELRLMQLFPNKAVRTDDPASKLKYARAVPSLSSDKNPASVVIDADFRQ